MSERTTIYRNRGYAQLIAVVALVFAVAALVSAIVRDTGDGGQPLSALDRWAPAVIVGLLSAFCLLRLARAGVYADARGIRVLNPLRTVRVPWDRVQRFSLRPHKGFPAVGFAELVDGSRVQIWGIQSRSASAAARRVPEQLIEQLNEALAQARAPGSRA